MVGNAKNGDVVKQETRVNMILWTPAMDEERMHYGVIYEFNESQAAETNEKCLTEIVSPKTPKNGTVIIHDHTDIIGEKASNQKLSSAWANKVKETLEKSLSKTGRKDVTFKGLDLGKINQSPFRE